MDTTVTNHEIRLRQATFCGTIRDSNEMTLVRLADVHHAAESIAYYREQAATLDTRSEGLKRECDDLKFEVKELRKGIAIAIQSLERTACATR